MKISKPILIFFTVALTAAADYAFYHHLINEKSNAVNDSSFKTDIDLLELNFNDEELIDISDLIVEGNISCKVKDVVYTDNDSYVPISYYNLKIKNYLNSETDTDTDILISLGVSDIINEIEFNKDYIFYLKQINEYEGKPLYCLVSVSQGLLDIKENNVVVDKKGETKSLTHLKEVIKKNNDK